MTSFRQNFKKYQPNTHQDYWDDFALKTFFLNCFYLFKTSSKINVNHL